MSWLGDVMLFVTLNMNEQQLHLEITMLTLEYLSAGLIKYLSCNQCSGVIVLYCSNGCQLNIEEM